jgi:hypothetical protein
MCGCVKCAICDGSGFMWRCLNGDLVKHRIDDMGDLETCQQCRGSGMSEICEEHDESLYESDYGIP